MRDMLTPVAGVCEVVALVEERVKDEGVVGISWGCEYDPPQGLVYFVNGDDGVCHRPLLGACAASAGGLMARGKGGPASCPYLGEGLTLAASR